MIEVLLFTGITFFNPQPIDSLGVKTIDGKVFVIHKVDEKETLYGLSKRYGTTVEEILKYNSSADAGLEIGIILNVPYTQGASSSALGKQSVHIVAPGETLYAISKQYQVSVGDIKKWNGLASNALSVGQELVVGSSGKSGKSVVGSQPAPQKTVVYAPKGLHQVAPKETLYGISKQYEVSVEDLRKWNNLESGEIQVGQRLIVSAPSGQPVESVVTTEEKEKGNQKPKVVVETKHADPLPEKTRTISITESVTDGDEIQQSGLAELIEGTEANRKYLALHRTAPKGTILKVKNEMNGREVFVRVMGKLPDTGVNDKLIIKVSKSAYDRLGAIDKKFRVEVTYYQ